MEVPDILDLGPLNVYGKPHTQAEKKNKTSQLNLEKSVRT